MSYQPSPLELDVLLLYYVFSDQYGNVDIKTANEHSKYHFGCALDPNDCVFTQEEMDALMDSGRIVDTRPMLAKFQKKPILKLSKEGKNGKENS